MTFDLYIGMLCNCLAYFSHKPQIQNWFIYWWEFCSLVVHYFLHVFLSVYFCFACQICVHAHFFGKIKTNASHLYFSFSLKNENSEVMEILQKGHNTEMWECGFKSSWNAVEMTSNSKSFSHIVNLVAGVWVF